MAHGNARRTPFGGALLVERIEQRGDLAESRVTLGGAICAAIGLTLLDDAQARAGDTLVWSSLAFFIGLATFVGAGPSRGDRAGRGFARSKTGGGAS